jgi:hypothetical protein
LTSNDLDMASTQKLERCLIIQLQIVIPILGLLGGPGQCQWSACHAIPPWSR